MERGQGEDREEREKEKLIEFILVCFFLPTPGLTHNDSTFCTECCREITERKEMALQRRKERFLDACREGTEFCHSYAASFFPIFLLKNKKKPVCYKMSLALSLYLKFFFCYRERFLCSSYLSVCVCTGSVCVCVIHKLSRDRTTHHSLL